MPTQKRHPSHLALALTLLAAPFAVQALTPSQVFERVKDSVVVIKSLNAKGEPLGQGSGVLLPSGKVATNCHVVKEGTRFQAGRDNSFVPATVFAADSDKDICILQADSLKGTPAQLGKAATLKVGEAVYAVGAPQGLELSLSNGLVSQLRGGTPPLIQTTAAISQGSSGGGLFDSEARLIGFTTYYYKDGQSLNFAMPVEWLADIKPGSKPTKSNRLSQVDWLTRAVELEKTKDFQKLLSWSQMWVKAEPKNASSWSGLGNANEYLKRYSEAVEAYQHALRLDPIDSSVWASLGDSYVGLERNIDAAEAYIQAIRFKPENTDAYRNLSITYFNLKRYTEAINAARQTLSIIPEDAGAWKTLGRTYVILNRHNEAVDAYRQSLRVKPTDATTWFYLGNAYNGIKRFNEAIIAYKESLRIVPQDAKTWLLLGIAYDSLVRTSEAIEAYHQSILINPENVDAWSLLASAYSLSGNKAAALQVIKGLRLLDPVEADRLFNMMMPK